jgi:predicted RNA methylase
MKPNELIPRDGILEIVGHRNRALELWARAFEEIERASKAVEEAEVAVNSACGGVRPAYVEPHEGEVQSFRTAVQLPDGDQYRRVAKRLTDIQVWGALIERTDMDHLMDKKAKDELREQMTYIPEKIDPRTGAVINAEEIARGLPEISVESIEQTLQGLVDDAGMIFRRGIANSFSSLDRRFRSHDGFKIGARVILTRAFDDWGHWNYYSNQRDTLIDIERVFLVLDGKSPRATYGGIVGEIETARKGEGLHRSVHEGDYFRVRVFKNGNAHLWFTRPDLVEKVNGLLADHYSLGFGKDAPEGDEEAFQTRAVGHAKGFGFFPTPKDVAERVLEEANLYRYNDDEPLRCLEPSAGTGVLARGMVEAGHIVHVIELQPELAEELEVSGHFGNVRCADFLKVRPVAVYDRIVMNPPFDNGRDIDHVRHAWDFLKPGGTLVAIMSAGVEFRGDRKSTAFRKLLERERAECRDLPAGSFAEAGTFVNTLYVRLTKSKK